VSSGVGPPDRGVSEAPTSGADALLARAAEATVDELLDLVRPIPATVPDVRTVAELRDLPVTVELDIGCYVGVPINLSDGRLYGTLCGFAHEPVD
jgi:hypothetical protein